MFGRSERLVWMHVCAQYSCSINLGHGFCLQFVQYFLFCGKSGKWWQVLGFFIFLPGIEATLITGVLYSGIVYRLPLSDLSCQDIRPENTQSSLEFLYLSNYKNSFPREW